MKSIVITITLAGSLRKIELVDLVDSSLTNYEITKAVRKMVYAKLDGFGIFDISWSFGI